MCIALYVIRIFHFWGYLFTHEYTCVVDMCIMHTCYTGVTKSLYTSHMCCSCAKFIRHVVLLSSKEIAQESHFCSCHVPPAQSGSSRGALGTSRHVQCACDLIKQRCYHSRYQSYSSIRTRQLRCCEVSYKTVTLELESEQNSAFFTNRRSQYSFASRFCILGFVLAAGSKLAARRKKLQQKRANIQLFSILLGKCGRGNLLIIIQNTRCVQKIQPLFCLFIYQYCFFCGGLLSPPQAKHVRQGLQCTCNGRHLRLNGTIYSTSSALVICRSRFFKKIIYWKCSS